jgi:antirepressor regulating drug resistance, predicted signal transduction N-terminal membrane component
MSGIFLKLLNLSISASWLVLVVLALRLVLKRAPKWVNVLLWGMVALRLMLPFSIESALSLIPSAETVSPEVVQFDPAPTITSGVEFIDNAVNPSLSESFAAAPLASVNPLYVWTYLAGWVWLIGLAAMLLYALVSYLRLRRCVRASIPLRENIYVCDEVPSPFILGIVHPRIYLPSALDEAQRGSVLSHERAHLARRDHWWKPLGFALLAVYWFNPLLWLAYTLLCRDIELACDERVLRGMDAGQVKAYSSALLACSVPRRMIAACPLAFGEVGVGARVKNALRYKKPAFWVIAASVIVCIVVAVCFLTNPRTDTDAAGLVGFYREQVTYADVTDESGAQPSSVQLTAEETDAVYALLDTLQYKRLGTASAMQDCYARLYFISAAGERCEVMLSEREMLVNPITDGRKARLYELRSGSTELRGYLLECIGASEAAEDADRVYTDAWSIRVLDGWEREGDSPLWRSGAGTGAYFLVTEGSGLDDKLMELYSAGWTLKYFSDHYRCTLREGESGTMLSFYPRPEGGFYQIESYWSYEGADKWQVRLEEGQLKVMEQSFRLRAAERGDPQDSEQAPAAAPWDGTMPDMPPTDTGGAQDSDEREEQRTEEDTAGSAYSVKVYAMTAEERSALDAQTEPAPAVGTAFLPRSSRDGASGNVCAPFTAKTADVAFVLYSAPGATDYNVRLCAGEPGAGKWASKAVTVKVNDGVRFSGLTVGQAYYMEVSSDTLSTAGCTALYKCATTPPPARSGAASTTGYAAYDALLAEIADLRRSGASDVQTDFSHDLLSVNDYYQTPGWLLRDLEGDGTSELLLGADWGDGCGVIFNIYRLDGAKAVRVVDGWSRSQYFLCSDGTLAHEWSGGADHWGRTYLRYGEALLPIESVFDRGGVWYHAKGLDALSLEDTQLEDRCKTISRAEAEQLMERYTKQYEALPFTPFAA